MSAGLYRCKILNREPVLQIGSLGFDRSRHLGHTHKLLFVKEEHMEIWGNEDSCKTTYIGASRASLLSLPDFFI